MEKIFEWFALTIGGVSGWVIGKFSPAFPLIIIATLFVLYDAWSAYELDKRVHRLGIVCYFVRGQLLQGETAESFEEVNISDIPTGPTFNQEGGGE